MKNKSVDDMIDDVIGMIDELLEDKSVPKNVRARIEDIKTNLGDEKEEQGVKIGTSISIMDDISNDPNLPVYARTRIWNIVSVMETIRTKV
jgi:uncharacterized protein (UPF0147 family)